MRGIGFPDTTSSLDITFHTHHSAGNLTSCCYEKNTSGVQNVDFLTPVRMLAEESGWTELFDSCRTFGRTVVFARSNNKVNIYLDRTGRIIRSVRYRFDEGIDVAHVYVTSVLPTNGQTTDSAHVKAGTGPTAVLALTLRVMGGWADR